MKEQTVSLFSATGGPANCRSDLAASKPGHATPLLYGIPISEDRFTASSADAPSSDAAQAPLNLQSPFQIWEAHSFAFIIYEAP